MNLSINFNKTKFQLYHKKSDPKSSTTHITFDHENIERKSSFRYLGIILDENMTFSDHYDYINNKISTAIGALHHILRLLSLQVFIQLLNSFVLSHLDYGVEVWGCIQVSKISSFQKKLDSILKSFFYPRLSKLYTKKFWCSKFIDSKSRLKLLRFSRSIIMTDLYEKCTLLTISERINYFTLMTTFKFFRLKEIFSNIITHFNFSTRNDETSLNLLTLARKYELFKNSFVYRSTELWNSLPRTFRSILYSKNQFALLINKHFLSLR
jgi:hypothetical protein